jgi:hypothetical protein
MSKRYNIKNIAAGVWAKYNPIHIHLATVGRGFETKVLDKGDVLEDVVEDRITDEIRLLARQKRERPPVLELIELSDEDAAEETPETVVEKSGGKKSKKKSTPQLSDDEAKALEAGDKLP